jgi:hypothetical protein
VSATIFRKEMNICSAGDICALKVVQIHRGQPFLDTAKDALRHVEAMSRTIATRVPSGNALKNYMTTALADFDKYGGLKPASDLSERQRPKACQPLPQCWKLSE